MFAILLRRIAAWASKRLYTLLGVLCLLLSLTLTANAMLTVSSGGLYGDAAVSVDGNGALSLGTSSSTSIIIGKTGIPVTIPGSLGVTGNTTLSGNLTLGSASSTGQLFFKNASTSFNTLLQASSSQSSNLTFTLPSTAGTAGQAMLTDGSGNLYFGSSGGASQWLTGSGISISYSSGNIGINTTTPQALLSIVGQASSTAPIFNVSSSSGTSLFSVGANGTVSVGSTLLPAAAPANSIAAVGEIYSARDAVVNRSGLDVFRHYIPATQSGVVNVVLLGDSITYGSSASDLTGTSWAALLRRYLTNLWGSAGYGYVNLYSIPTTASGTNLESAVISNGTVYSQGTMRFKNLYVINGKNTDGGTMIITVDGTGYTVDCSGAARQYGIHTLVYSGTTITDHTVSITAPTTGNGYIEGFILSDNSSGVVVHQMGHTGIEADQYDANAIAASITAFTPRLTVIALGMNDYLHSKTVADYQTAMQSIAAAATASGACVILKYMDPSDGQYNFAQFMAAADAVAVQYNCAVVDMQRRWKNSTTMVANGFGTSGDPHPNDAGHMDIFNAFRDLFRFSDVIPDRSYTSAFITGASQATYQPTNSGISSVMGTTNQVSVSTASGVATISLPSQVTLPQLNVGVSENQQLLSIASPTSTNQVGTYLYTAGLGTFSYGMPGSGVGNRWRISSGSSLALNPLLDVTGNAVTTYSPLVFSSSHTPSAYMTASQCSFWLAADNVSANVDCKGSDGTLRTATIASLGTNNVLQLVATTGSIGGSALGAGACASGTVNVTNATVAMVVDVSPTTYPGDGMAWRGYVSAPGTVTVKVCAEVAGTPTASTYNVRVNE